MSDTARTIEWDGKQYTLDLGAERVLDVLMTTGGGYPMKPIQVPFVMMEMGIGGPMNSHGPFPGQYGDTPAACLKRFENAVYSLDDVKRIFILGIWGGGTTAADAIKLYEKHVKGKPLAATATIAYEVLGALFVGAAA